MKTKVSLTSIISFSNNKTLKTSMKMTQSKEIAWLTPNEMMITPNCERQDKRRRTHDSEATHVVHVSFFFFFLWNQNSTELYGSKKKKTGPAWGHIL